MTLTANGTPVTSVEQHTAITLTATVKAGATTLKLGQIKFCDATAKYCEDNHLLGVAQLTSAGTAIFRTSPSPGTHNYKAVFAGTTANSSSSSAAETVTVTGSSPTTAAIAAVGSGGAYTLTGTLRATAGGLAPTGELYFLDRTDSAAELGKASLATGIAPSLSWTQSLNYPLDAGYGDKVVFGDFNNDGHEDFVLVKDYPATILLHVGDGKGHFKRSKIASGAPQGYGYGIVVADFNNDGNQDFAIVPPSQPLNIYLGKGDGTFTREEASAAFYFAEDLLTADFNHDGNVDLAFADNGNGVTVLLGNGDGTFKTSPLVPLKNAFGLRLGDFDGDGNMDIAQVDQNKKTGGIVVLYGNGDGTFVQKKAIRGAYFDIEAADFNDDGRTDLTSIVAGTPPAAQLLLGDAGRSFKAEPQVDLLDYVYPDPQGIGDFDGDGNIDVIFSLRGDAGAGQAELLRGNGAGALVPASLINDGTLNESTFLGVTDLDEDGTSDMVLIPYPQDSSYQVLLTQLNYSASVSGKPTTGPGTHQVVARYEGDDNFDGSASSPIALSPLTTSAPVATLSTLAIPFGEQPVGAPGNAKTVLLTNTGAAALHLNSFSLVPAPDKGLSFASLNNCPASLAAGASCKIRIRFVPGSPGRKMTSLVITDNAANSPQTITLTGTGTDEP